MYAGTVLTVSQNDFVKQYYFLKILFLKIILIYSRDVHDHICPPSTAEAQGHITRVNVTNV